MLGRAHLCQTNFTSFVRIASAIQTAIARLQHQVKAAAYCFGELGCRPGLRDPVRPAATIVRATKVVDSAVKVDGNEQLATARAFRKDVVGDLKGWCELFCCGD